MWALIEFNRNPYKKRKLGTKRDTKSVCTKRKKYQARTQ